MKFEEQFPSLKGKELDSTGDDFKPYSFLAIVIQKHCLDKQRVREAITKFKSRSENRWTDGQVEDFLKQELGL